VYAIEVTETGGPDVLTYVERPRPTPGPGQVLIKAEAIGVYFIDTHFRSGLYPHQLPFIVGSEVCGTVAEVGADVTSVRVGDRVASADASERMPNIALRPSI
jgi:NADPH:quinone reductase